MPSVGDLLTFAVVALAIVCTPGPNMIYLLSRSICQGTRAGLISLAGVGSAFLVYMAATVFGLAALLATVPVIFDLLRATGAAYLLYLAWQVIRPGGRSLLAVAELSPDQPGKLFAMGFLTNLLNPKAAVLYLTLLPQFIRPDHGSILAQGLVLGSTQIGISMSVNASVVLGAGSLARTLANRPRWQLAQRWLMAAVLAMLALRMVLTP